MGRRTPEPRYIKPETICIGDTVKVSYEDADISYSRVGVIAKRVHTLDGTSYQVASGEQILFVNRSGNRYPNGTITLLDRKAADAATLDGLDV